MKQNTKLILILFQSMEGKVIGQASGFKLNQLTELENGSILKVGGREVLVSIKLNKKHLTVCNDYFSCD